MLVAKQIFEKLDLALTLLVTQVLADHHDSTVTANHFALLADLLDALAEPSRLLISCFVAARRDEPRQTYFSLTQVRSGKVRYL